MRRLPWILLLSLFVAGRAAAHDVRPGYLELRQTSADAYDVLWKVPATGESLPPDLEVRLPESCELVGEPRGTFVGGAYVRRWSVRAPRALAGSTIRVDGLETTLADVLVRVERLDGSTQVARLTPDAPSMVLEAVPGRWQVASTYLVLGVDHILLGADHLLFVLALVLLVKGWKRLVETITSFTVAHSLTLAAATLGFVHVPSPPVEACIALSIVFVAAELVHCRQGRPGLTERAPWLIAFTFGLLHGLGFAGALSEVGLPRGAIPTALLFFNVGVELGQLLFVGVALVTLAALDRLRLADWSRRLAPYAIGGLAMFWVIDRTAGFWA